jgi:hypothetical protein
VDVTEDGFRCLGDPSFREEERFGRDDARVFLALAFVDLARVFTAASKILLLRPTSASSAYWIAAPSCGGEATSG